MRSTIVIFVIVFAILGLLLGFAESYNAEPTSNMPMAKDIQLRIYNNSDEPCNDNSTDCIAIFQKP